jgi:single-strand DNA-binding protein
MFETQVTIVGHVLTAPEWRRLEKSGRTLTTFRVASNSRRFDKENGRWVDGSTLRLRVSCWRTLSDGVAQSLAVGDPVIVVGKLYTRDWTTEDNERRVVYEMDAHAVGHNLSRGTSSFKRRKPTGTVAIEDEEADAFIAGEMSRSAPELNAGTMRPTGREESDADFDEFDFAEFPAEPPVDEALAILRASGVDPETLGGDGGGATGTDPADGGSDGAGDGDSDGTGADGDGDGDAATRGAGRGRRRGRQAVPA